MAITFEEKNSIGYVTFDNPERPVNVLTADVIRQLDGMLDELKTKTSLKAIVFQSAKKGIFIAGADIKEIEKITEANDGAAKAKAGQDVFNKIEDLNVPTIAVINGAALGGGCELVLACDYRIATFSEKVKIGVPEVNLGFVPGFGGTYRLPRIVGLQEAMKMILAGKPVDSTKALKIGLVSQLIPESKIDLYLKDFIDGVLDGSLARKKYARKKKRGFAGFLDNNPIGQKIVFSQSRKSVLQKTKGFYPAPLKAIEVVQRNLFMDREKGLEVERKAFGELAITLISKNCVHLFYLSEKFKKLTLDGAEDVKPQTIHKCGVLGAGIMGGGIAQLFAYRDIPVRLKDISHDAIAKGYQAASKVFGGLVKRRRLSKSVATRKMDLISGAIDYSGFGNADIVIEAVVEKMEVKQKVFAELSEVTSQNAILATNTSALSVTEIAKATKDPSRVIGFHFFNPVHLMPLVEVITTDQTSKETIVTTLDLVKRLGKTPILVKDSAGFVVNRILLAYMNEAGVVLEEGAGIEEIDQAMLEFGMPMGPFTLSDEVGLDVGVKVLRILEEAFGSRYTPVKTFDRVLEKGYLGKKSGSGFYSYAVKNRKMINSKAIKEVQVTNRRNFNEDDCQKRLVYIMINEASRCLEDGIVDGPGTIDIGMIFGTGFPPFRGGLLKYADTVGIDNVVKELIKLNEELKTDRFTPSEYLLNLQKNNQTFYK